MHFIERLLWPLLPSYSLLWKPKGHEGSLCSGKRYCYCRKNSSHTYECRLTESKICVDNTSRGLLLTERQVRAPLCGKCGTKLLKSWAFGQFTVYNQKRSLHSEVKIALRNEVGDADSSMTNSVLTVEGWWKSLNSKFMVGRILLWQQYYFSEEKYA